MLAGMWEGFELVLGFSVECGVWGSGWEVNG